MIHGKGSVAAVQQGKVSGIDRHPLRGLLPKKKVSTYNLRNQTSQYPKVNTDRFKNSYVNRLIFKYNLAM